MINSLRNSVGHINTRLKTIHPRTQNALLNSFWGLLIKGGGMAINLVMVPLTLSCLDNSTFGVWTTLSSLLMLLAFFDIGLGNGLRNKLAVALSTNDIGLAQSYVSTAYVMFGGIQLILIALFTITNTIIPWATILNTTVPNSTLKNLALVLFTGISIKLLLDLLTFVLYARQESAKANLLIFLTNLLSLLGLLILIHFKEGNLFSLGIITAFSPVFLLIIASIFLYKGSLKHIRPFIYLYRREHVKSLLGIGSKFFLVQIAVIVIFYSDNLIITQLFGPTEVTSYNIAFRYFNVINTLFAIVIAPYWSAFTEAHMKGEYHWMRTIYRRLWWFWAGAVGLVIVGIIFASSVYEIWVGDRVQIPTMLNVCMGLSVIVACFNNVAVVVINGLGKIKLQLILSFLSATINIPLCVFLGKHLNMGSTGVILATSLSLLCGSVGSVLQAHRLLNRSATGIWAK
ncbi:hypothetical protein J2I47_15435 [Fibrella sp. HMF5335]|uniref:Membrane protein involved in the export of O-antigen and teichoic acid n=1 Tax=Fibrella rubiginis TaxID=2817060 RepID=A0A939GHM0_9BACT|nr:hypothetical protein [Fibrella rubiginis]MBO0937948.1 hypothetical protein [Fibrella rubiginis]